MSTQASTGRNWASVAAGIAVAFVVVEIVSVFVADVPVGVGLFFAALFAVAWYLLRQRSFAGIVLFGVLALVEVVFVPAYDRDDAGDWIIQIIAALLGIAGVVAAVALFRERRPRAAV